MLTLTDVELVREQTCLPVDLPLDKIETQRGGTARGGRDTREERHTGEQRRRER